MRLSDFLMDSAIEENGSGGWIIEHTGHIAGIASAWIEVSPLYQPEFTLNYIERNSGEVYVIGECFSESEKDLIREVVSFYADN